MLLGMPCHTECSPRMDYEKGLMYVGDLCLKCGILLDDGRVKVTSIGVKRFRKMIQRRNKGIEIFQAISKNQFY